jgi:CheY-like chemotaxis protein
MREAAMSRTVLVVDDDPSIRAYVAEALEDAGYAVEAAESAAEALDALERAVPDAIVLDMWMPSMDGFDFMRPLRESDRTKDVPVVAMSAAYPERAALDLGAKAFLAKPFDVGQLLDAVDGALGAR